VLSSTSQAHLSVLLTRLADYKPDPYQSWTTPHLITTPASHGITPTTVTGLLVLRTDDITHALTHHNHTDNPDHDDNHDDD
jgi:hypothetical protein